jgi:hypothetical protein
VIRRRRQAFLRLLAAAGLSLLLGVIPHLHAFLVLHLGLDAGIAIYVLQLRRWRKQEFERAHTPAPATTALDDRVVQPITHVGLEDDEEDISIRLPDTPLRLDAEPVGAVRRSS